MQPDTDVEEAAAGTSGGAVPDAHGAPPAAAAAAAHASAVAQQAVQPAQALQVQSLDGHTAALAPIAQHIVSEEQLEILRIFQQVCADALAEIAMPRCSFALCTSAAQCDSVQRIVF